ncbi:hypothetical protein L841_0555 [Mycobacterium sp. MAC_080597_8934]|nr:hypothetical protein L840_5174 [Mycobacterium sp. MAC_011194_8550]ETZ74957.1 hypothetical protein L841_0555 [Mycobacterium sp. MAC_080597_8934]
MSVASGRILQVTRVPKTDAPAAPRQVEPRRKMAARLPLCGLFACSLRS